MEPSPWTLCSVLAENDEVQGQGSGPSLHSGPTVLYPYSPRPLLLFWGGGEEHLRLGRVLGFGSTAWLEQVYGYLGGAYREMDEMGS